MENKQRHGCVTAWLIFMIIANSLSSLSNLFFGDFISDSLPEAVPQSMLTALALIGFLNVFFAVMLFQWKKWAFFAFAGMSLVTLYINLSVGIPVGSSLMGLVGMIVLYAILQIKQDGVSAWENLD